MLSVWPFGRGEDAAAERDRLPPAEERYVALDTELTGLDLRRDSIVSLAGLRLAHGRIDLADRFYEEVRPASALTAESIVLHGITPEQVNGHPGIGPVLAGFCAYCGGDLLVGHFVEIDLGFLHKEFARAGRTAPTWTALDTWPLYEWLSSRVPDDGGPGLPRLHDPRLPELAQALGVPSGGGHNALDDAFVTAQVFQRLLRLLPRWGVTTLGKLLRIADPRLASERHAGYAPPLS